MIPTINECIVPRSVVEQARKQKGGNSIRIIRKSCPSLNRVQIYDFMVAGYPRLFEQWYKKSSVYCSNGKMELVSIKVVGGIR